MTFSHQAEINQPFKLTIYVTVIRTCKTTSFFLGFYAAGYTKQDRSIKFWKTYLVLLLIFYRSNYVIRSLCIYIRVKYEPEYMHILLTYLHFDAVIFVHLVQQEHVS